MADKHNENINHIDAQPIMADKIMKNENSNLHGVRRWTAEEDQKLRVAVNKYGGKYWKLIAEDVPGRTHTQCLQRWCKVLKPGLLKGPWCEKEDQLLTNLVYKGIEDLQKKEKENNKHPDIYNESKNQGCNNDKQNELKKMEKGLYFKKESTGSTSSEFSINSASSDDTVDMGLIPNIYRKNQTGSIKDMSPASKINWTLVSESIPGRSIKQCRERWFSNLDPNINRGNWTEEEDRLLMETQIKNGNRWALIARKLPGRTEHAVKTRYRSLVRAKKREWSTEEDNTLREQYRLHGKNWAKIALKFNGTRSKNAVMTRLKIFEEMNCLPSRPNKRRRVNTYFSRNKSIWKRSEINNTTDCKTLPESILNTSSIKQKQENSEFQINNSDTAALSMLKKQHHQDLNNIQLHHEEEIKKIRQGELHNIQVQQREQLAHALLEFSQNNHRQPAQLESIMENVNEPSQCNYFDTGQGGTSSDISNANNNNVFGLSSLPPPPIKLPSSSFLPPQAGPLQRSCDNKAIDQQQISSIYNFNDEAKASNNIPPLRFPLSQTGLSNFVSFPGSYIDNKKESFSDRLMKRYSSTLSYGMEGKEMRESLLNLLNNNNTNDIIDKTDNNQPLNTLSNISFQPPTTLNNITVNSFNSDGKTDPTKPRLARRSSSSCSNISILAALASGDFIPKGSPALTKNENYNDETNKKNRLFRKNSSSSHVDIPLRFLPTFISSEV